jgi:hypothetical protein
MAMTHDDVLAAGPPRDEALEREVDRITDEEVIEYLRETINHDHCFLLGEISLNDLLDKGFVTKERAVEYLDLCTNHLEGIKGAIALARLGRD